MNHQGLFSIGCLRSHDNGLNQWEKTSHMWGLLSLAETVLMWTEVIDIRNVSRSLIRPPCLPSVIGVLLCPILTLCIFVSEACHYCIKSEKGYRKGTVAPLLTPAHASPYVSVISHKHHGIPNHRQLDCVFKSLFKLTKWKPHRSA